MTFFSREDSQRYWGYYPLIYRARYVGLTKSLRTAYNLGLKKIDTAFNRTNLLSKPMSLQIEPTTKCNLRCKFCISPIWNRRGMDMSIGDFRRIINQFPFLEEILLQGIGEPLMCDDLFEMLDLCREKRILVTITTNGTLMNNPLAERLVNTELKTIVISLDAATKDTFERVREGARFDEVLKNIRNLIRVKRGRKLPYVVINFTASLENIHELPDAVRLAKDLGVDGVETWGVHFWADKSLKELHSDKILDNNIQEGKKFLNEAISVAEELGIPLTLTGSGNRRTPFLESDTQLHADQRMCRKVFKSCFITVDGFVTTCADSPNPEKMNFGNLLKEDFSGIWNNPKYIGMRKSRLKGKIPDQCVYCTGPHTAI